MNSDIITAILGVITQILLAILVISNVSLAIVSRKNGSETWLWFLSLGGYFLMEIINSYSFFFLRLVPKITGELNTTFTSTLPLRYLGTLIVTWGVFYFIFVKKYNSHGVPKKKRKRKSKKNYN
jgi:hypothetical protein